jgi:hypothetical protein
LQVNAVKTADVAEPRQVKAYDAAQIIGILRETSAGVVR